MTTDQMRIAVAESLGWKEVWHEGERIIGFTPPSDTKTCHNRKYEIPNYPADLNAIQEAWRTLSDAEKRKFYSVLSNLPEMCKLVSKNVLTQDYLVIGATAHQQTEAYLRVKGIWK